MTMPQPVVNTSRDREITALVIDQNKSFKEVAKLIGVHPTRINQIINEQTNRDKIMAFLAEHRDQKFNSREIAMALRLDINKVQFVADRLRLTGRGKADDLPSSGSAGGDHKMLANIRLTDKGLNEIQKRAKIMVEEAIAEEVPEAAPVEEVPEGATEEPTETPLLSPGEAPEKAELAIHDIPHFPLIHQLTNRNEKLQQASKLIEAAGPYDELALSVLAKLDDFTPLEREILEYVRKYGMEDA